MAQPFPEADDVFDAAADGVRAIDARLSRLGLQLQPEAFAPLRELLAAALSLTGVEGLEPAATEQTETPATVTDLAESLATHALSDLETCPPEMCAEVRAAVDRLMQGLSGEVKG